MLTGHRQRLVVVLVLLVVGISALGRAGLAYASNQTANLSWATTVTGPASATVGQTVTYTVTLTNVPPAPVGLTPPFEILFPAGATNIAVTGPCGGSLTSTTSPATYTSCPPGTLLFPGVPAIFTVTLTLTAAAQPSFTLTYRDPSSSMLGNFPPFAPDATWTTAVFSVPGVTLTATPNPVFPGLPVTLIATVSCPAATPTGMVSFTSNGITLATATLTNGTATATIPASAVTGAVVANYSGDGACAAAMSAPLVIGVQAPVPVIYTETIAVTGCGTTTPQNLPVLALQNVSITAVPCPGSRFVGWTGGPCDKTTINPCSIPAGTPVTANFAP